VGQNRRPRRGFGAVRRLPSKRYQASYTGPDTARYVAPHTFDTLLDAEAWLTDERRLISAGTWLSPTLRNLSGKSKPLTFGEYAESWLRRRDLKPRTRGHYETLLRTFLLPRFESTPIRGITPTMVADWHHDLGKTTGPTYRAHAYSLLRTSMATAISEDELTVSPCRIRGAGSVKRARRIEPATLPQLAAALEAMPKNLQAMVLLSSWCGLRFGEVTELRRKDVDLRGGVLHIRRGVTWVKGKPIVGTPKSDAGVRDVAIPPHLIPALKAHIAEHAAWGRDGLLFPARDGGHLPSSTLYGHWHAARDTIGRPDLRWHDLRHTGAVLAAATGATLAELMARLGHSTPSAALRYQHAAKGRDAEIAAKLSEIAGRN
jgi:integrase